MEITIQMDYLRIILPKHRFVLEVTSLGYTAYISISPRERVLLSIQRQEFPGTSFNFNEDHNVKFFYLYKQCCQILSQVISMYCFFDYATGMWTRI